MNAVIRAKLKPGPKPSIDMILASYAWRADDVTVSQSCLTPAALRPSFSLLSPQTTGPGGGTSNAVNFAIQTGSGTSPTATVPSGGGTRIYIPVAIREAAISGW